MSSVRLRTDGRYELRFYYNKKQYSVYDQQLINLNNKKRQKIKALKQQTQQAINQYKNKYTLKQWYEIWLETYKKPFIKPDSLENIVIYFKKHILKVFGNYTLEQITINELQSYLNKLEKNRTKELIITYFNACLQKACDLDYMTKNPFKLVVRDKKIKKVRPAFTIEQQEAILNHIKSKDYNFYKLILFYLATGCRRSEALQIEQSDFNNNVLHIKGTKTDKSDRYILITNELKELIFKNNNKIFDYRKDFVTDKFRDYLSELKISGTLHCLRHSYATNQYYIGTPAKEVQMNMGHSDVTITLDIYTNIDIKQNKKEILEKIKALYNNYYIELKN